MAILLTGATGYLGSYIVAELLTHCRERLALLVRAESNAAARQRLWQALQLHMDFAHFQDALERCDLYVGDITQSQLGLTATAWHRLVCSTTAVIHTAAAVNRLSLRRCMEVNLRGTLAVIQLAHAAHAHHGLRRFSAVSTVSVAGFRHDVVVSEDEALPGNHYDNDPYGVSKQCCEALIHALLADVPYTIFRPSAILGDSRFPQTTQFDNARAFVTFARAGVLPLPPEWHLDLVPADYVGRAIVSLHQKDRLAHQVYHLSAGVHAPTYQEIVDSLRQYVPSPGPFFVPALRRPVVAMVTAAAALPRHWRLTRAATLLKVFMPYLLSNTVFDNTRATTELGMAPPPFQTYAGPLYQFLIAHRCRYPYQPWPEPRAIAGHTLGGAAACLHTI
jgi:thioester reductase-like protein